VQDRRLRDAVCGEHYPLTDRQRESIDIAESLGPGFSERAARYDRDATFPFENYGDLRAAGLLGLCVPERFGGRGADFKAYSLVSATLGKYCGANDLCRLAIRTCGGRSMLKSLPLERLYRDSRCRALMLPWTAELCLDRNGREALYEPGEADD